MLERSRELGKHCVACWALKGIDSVIVLRTQVVTFQHIVTVFFVYIVPPVIAYGCRFVKVNNVDTRLAATGLQVDYHAGVGGECPGAAIALYRAVEMDNFVL